MRRIVKQVGKGIRAHDDKNQLQRMQDIIETDSALVGVEVLDAHRVPWTEVTLVLPGARTSVGTDKRLGGTGDVVQMSAAELKRIGEIVADTFRVGPDAVPPKTRLEALNADDGEEEPEEADQKGDMNEQWSSLLETPQNDLWQHLRSGMHVRGRSEGY